MKIAVRMDDITPDMNWENFNFFLALFEKTGITPLLGIVPDNKDDSLSRETSHEDFYEFMKTLEKKGFTLAMHGCHHVYSTKNGGLFPLNKYSEFAGLPYDRQKELLRYGKEKLKANGIETDIFMAPAHSYDTNTLKALKELGFAKITDGFGKHPYIYRGLVFYPISFRLAGSFKKKTGVTTMVIHANTVNETARADYEKLFKEQGKNMISYSEYLAMRPAKRNFLGMLVENVMARIKHLLISLRNM
ncbi:MAG: DUF2334 domain-containing protein [Lachnospiraceae bacterium]|nr:DUF2334 domain-containing protein [Lachnospiraceae bacterium]